MELLHMYTSVNKNRNCFRIIWSCV